MRAGAQKTAAKGGILQAQEEPRRRGLRTTALVVCFLLSTTAAFPAARTLVPEGKGPGGAALYLWEPGDSYPGAALHDPRLDSPVRLWRAGISLAELATEVETQTGVQLDFWPGADENPRLRINVFLNAEDPPTLRDLLAQLAWVTGCTFAWTEPRTGVERAYFLLSTSLGEEALSLRDAAELTAQKRAEVAERAKAERDMEAAVAELEELRHALTLSREEAIRRYRGVNDFLLLTVLDAERRAAAEFGLQALADSRADSRWLMFHAEWGDIAEDQQLLLRTALRIPDDWAAAAAVHIDVDAGSVCVSEVSEWIPHEDGSTTTALLKPVGARGCLKIAETREDQPMTSEEVCSLGRLLGDEIPPEAERDYYSRWREDWSNEHARARRERVRRSLRNTVALSDDVRETLSSVPFPQGAEQAYPLWQVQEWVSASTGLHIISDCFWQGWRLLDSPESALDALLASTAARPERVRRAYGLEPWYAEAWEWGDAGPFLHFRSVGRGTWRASLLPEPVVRSLDAYLDPLVAAAISTPRSRDTVPRHFPDDLQKLLEIASQLNDLQLEYGGRMSYEDPAETEGAWPRAIREAFLRPAMDNVDFFRLLASLSADQWQRASGDGLPCRELSEEHLKRMQAALRRQDFITTRDRLSTLALKTCGAFPTSVSPAVRSPEDDLYLFRSELVDADPPREDLRSNYGFRCDIPASLWLYPSPTSRLLEPEESREDSTG